MDYESQFMIHNEDMQEIYDAIQDVFDNTRIEKSRF